MSVFYCINRLSFFPVSVTVSVIFYSSVTIIVTVVLIIFFSYFAISVTVTVNLINTDLVTYYYTVSGCQTFCSTSQFKSHATLPISFYLILSHATLILYKCSKQCVCHKLLYRCLSSISPCSSSSAQQRVRGKGWLRTSSADLGGRHSWVVAVWTAPVWKLCLMSHETVKLVISTAWLLQQQN